MIQGCMRGIPEATVVILMAEERAEREGLARSTKTEHRMRQRARIVLLAVDGASPFLLFFCYFKLSTRHGGSARPSELVGVAETGRAWLACDRQPSIG